MKTSEKCTTNNDTDIPAACFKMRNERVLSQKIEDESFRAEKLQK